jgi:hypothetical protein
MVVPSSTNALVHRGGPMYQVSVSARILSFPNICCCCASPGPNGKFTAAATRVTGKRVIKTQERSWAFPICAECIEWRDAVLRGRTVLILTFLSSALTFYLGLENLLIFTVCLAISIGLGVAFFFMDKHSDKIKVATAASVTPVVYHEWNGSVHFFSISNKEFYEGFCSANHSKLIGF